MDVFAYLREVHQACISQQESILWAMAHPHIDERKQRHEKWLALRELQRAVIRIPLGDLLHSDWDLETFDVRHISEHNKEPYTELQFCDLRVLVGKNYCPNILKAALRRRRYKPSESWTRQLIQDYSKWFMHNTSLLTHDIDEAEMRSLVEVGNQIEVDKIATMTRYPTVWEALNRLQPASPRLHRVDSRELITKPYVCENLQIAQSIWKHWPAAKVTVNFLPLSDNSWLWEHNRVLYTEGNSPGMHNNRPMRARFMKRFFKAVGPHEVRGVIQHMWSLDTEMQHALIQRVFAE